MEGKIDRGRFRQTYGPRARCNECQREWRAPTLREVEAVAIRHVEETGHPVNVHRALRKTIRRAT